MSITDILVIAKYRFSLIEVDAWDLWEGGGYDPNPFISPEGTGGGPPPETIYFKRVRCTIPDQAAKRISDHIDFNLVGSESVEFSATILGAGGGYFQTYQDKIWTSLDPSEVSIHFPPPDGLSSVVMTFHTHPVSLEPSPTLDALNRYPSPKDWEEAARIVNAYSANHPSLLSLKLAIRGPDKKIRIFNFSDRARYESKSVADKIAGVDLPPEVSSTASCEP